MFYLKAPKSITTLHGYMLYVMTYYYLDLKKLSNTSIALSEMYFRK